MDAQSIVVIDAIMVDVVERVSKESGISYIKLIELWDLVVYTELTLTGETK